MIFAVDEITSDLPGDETGSDMPDPELPTTPDDKTTISDLTNPKIQFKKSNTTRLHSWPS